MSASTITTQKGDAHIVARINAAKFLSFPGDGISFFSVTSIAIMAVDFASRSD